MANSSIRAHQIRVLAGVAGHHAAAVEAVSLGECQWVAAEIVGVLGALENLIHLLETGMEVPTSRLGLLLTTSLRGSS